jgi:hypothetical protein
LSSHHRAVLGASRSKRVAAQTLTRLRAARFGLTNGVYFECRAKRSFIMSKLSKASKVSKVSKVPMPQASNVLLVEVPPQFIALCESSGVCPQASLRGLAAMVCGLRYDEQNRLWPLEDTDVRLNG